MTGHIDRVRQTVFSILLNSDSLDGWVAELRRSPTLKPFTLWIQSPPFVPMTPFALAKLAQMEERAFRIRVKNLVGLTPIEMATSLRLADVIRQLRDTDVSVKSIIDGSGFDSTSALGHHFKRYLGRSPSSFRRNAPPSLLVSGVAAG